MSRFSVNNITNFAAHTEMIHNWKLQSKFIVIEWKRATRGLFNIFSIFVKKGGGFWNMGVSKRYILVFGWMFKV